MPLANRPQHLAILRHQLRALVDHILALQKTDLLRRLIASRRQVLVPSTLAEIMGDMRLADAECTDALPRMLMSLRQALPACEYEVLQNLPA